MKKSSREKIMVEATENGCLFFSEDIPEIAEYIYEEGGKLHRETIKRSVENDRIQIGNLIFLVAGFLFSMIFYTKVDMNLEIKLFISYYIFWLPLIISTIAVWIFYPIQYPKTAMYETAALMVINAYVKNNKSKMDMVRILKSKPFRKEEQFIEGLKMIIYIILFGIFFIKSRFFIILIDSSFPFVLQIICVCWYIAIFLIGLVMFKNLGFLNRILAPTQYLIRRKPKASKYYLLANVALKNYLELAGQIGVTKEEHINKVVDGIID